MIKNLPVTTEDLKGIISKASDVIQKNAEAAGTLKMIEEILHEHEKFSSSDEIWALRSAIRSIESAIEDAADITDCTEQLKEIKNV